jgi:hypothetical protein
VLGVHVMQIEVDQSGKIGKTDIDTILALSNNKSYSICIPRKVKQACLLRLRSKGLQPNTIYMRLFAVGLYFLLRDHITSVQGVLIDVEYPGKERQIKEHLFNLLHRAGIDTQRTSVAFAYVGKRSNAHSTAIAVFPGKRHADLTLTVEDIFEQF